MSKIEACCPRTQRCMVCMHRNGKTILPLIQRWREDDYTWAGPKAWACFRPDMDVLVPMYYSSLEEGVVSPFSGHRDITLLMRFGYQVCKPFTPL